MKEHCAAQHVEKSESALFGKGKHWRTTFDPEAIILSWADCTNLI
jgi:hypothetical protein